MKIIDIIINLKSFTMRKRIKSQDGERMLHIYENCAVEAVDQAIKNVALLARVREENQLSASRVRAVAKELAELRKILSVYLPAPQVVDSVPTGN